jgi:hypothetical protein
LAPKKREKNQWGSRWLQDCPETDAWCDLIMVGRGVGCVKVWYERTIWSAQMTK